MFGVKQRRFSPETRAIVMHRRQHKALIADGWIEIHSHGPFPADLHTGGSGRYSAVRLHPDRSRVYVKVDGRKSCLLDS
jgi:hypothetical protein